MTVQNQLKFVVLWLSPSFVSVPSLLSFFSVFSVPFYLSWFWTVTLLLLALRHDLLFVTLYTLNPVNKTGFVTSTRKISSVTF